MLTTKDFLNINVGKHFEMKMRSYNLGEHADAYWLHSAPNPPCVKIETCRTRVSKSFTVDQNPDQTY